MTAPTRSVDPRAVDPLLEDPSVVEAGEVAGALRVDPATGLSGAEAARRLASVGPNELRHTPPEPFWHRLLRQFQDPLVYLLLVAILVAGAAWAVEGHSGWPIDVIVIAVIVLANAVIGLLQEARAADAVAALADLTAPTSTVLRDGSPLVVPSATLVPGDVLELAEGDWVGADARLVSAAGLRVQEAALTGESAPVDKTSARIPEPVPLADRTCMVFQGTAVAQGLGRAVVTATGMRTEVGAIAELLDVTETRVTPLQREIAAVSRSLGAAVLAIAVVVMAAIALLNGIHSVEDAVTVLLLGVSLAVAAVPEGLPAILSLVLAIGVQAMARRNAVVKRLHSVQTLGCATVICSDKTGTLTQNAMSVRCVVTPAGTVELDGVGYAPQGAARVLGDAADTLPAARLLLAAGSLASTAHLQLEEGGWVAQGDPTEAALLAAAGKVDGAADLAARHRRVGQVPFTSQRKLMSALVVADRPDEPVLVTKGAPDVLLTRCTRIRRGEDVAELTAADRAELTGEIERLSERGLRVLAAGYRHLDPTGPEPTGPEPTGPDPAEVEPVQREPVQRERVGPEPTEQDERDLVWLGMVGILDPPRPQALPAVADARRAGVRVVMITGDHPRTAARIAADLGICRPSDPVATGVELDELAEPGLTELLERTSVFARVAPEHKLRIVSALQSRGEVVAMTGDGVNDAPALKAADIGVAMGLTGTEVSKGASAMILGDDDFATIVEAVRQGRVIFDNITKFLRYLLSSNTGEVLTVFFGVVLAGALGLTDAATGGELVVPLLATQILWINLVTDSGPALAMGVDPQIDDVMARPPRRPDARILDRPMWLRIGGIGLVMAAVTLLSIDAVLPGGLIAGSGTIAAARTAGFTTLVLAQLFNALASRSDVSSAFRHLFVNRWLWASLVLGAVLQVLVVTVPFLQSAFGTVPLTAGQWLLTVVLASAVLWVSELVKLVLRHRV